MHSVLNDLPPVHMGQGRLRTGLDLVEIRRIEESVKRFGPRFVHRLFSTEEAAYALSSEALAAQRLAARFAAKEATIKAFDMSEAGIGWRDIEVRRESHGACRLVLHGKAADHVARLGVREIALSLSHDGEYAAAVVTALMAPQGAVPLSSFSSEAE